MFKLKYFMVLVLLIVLYNFNSFADNGIGDNIENPIIVGEGEIKVESDNILMAEPFPHKNPNIKILSDSDKYLLAKIVMCEAGNQDIQTKMLVALVILNRVESPIFPDSIQEVIFQRTDKIYQFSPIKPKGSWYYTEPDSTCYLAVELALIPENNISQNALYFESCSPNRSS